MTEIERRFTKETVTRETSEGRAIGGYAAKFNRLSQNLGGFVEQIHPRFFAKSEGDGFPEVMARYNHDDMALLGTTSARTLQLRTDSVGLAYDVDVPMTRDDVLELVSRGDVQFSSFAFRLPSDGDDWDVTENGFPQRTLLTGQLVDVAPVNTPAYLDTSTGLASLARRVEAEFDEVRRAAEEGNLKKFFGPKETVVDAKPKNVPGLCDRRLNDIVKKRDPRSRTSTNVG